MEIKVDQARLIFSGADLVTVIDGLKELPYRRALPVIQSIENQLKSLYMPETPEPAPEPTIIDGPTQ